MEKLKIFFKKIFKRKERKNKVLFKMPKKKGFLNKRKNFDIKINLWNKLKFFKKNYIPYYLIFWLILSISIVFIILWPLFRIEKINIIKKDWITNINIAYKSIEDFRWISIFNIEKTEVLNKLKDYQENIKDINLKLDFPKTMDITIESFKEKFNININWKNYILLENWALVPTINKNKNLKDLEVIKNIEKTKILDYKVVFDMQYIQKIEEIEKKVRENIGSIEINILKYYEKERELHLIVNNITRLIFSLDNNISIDEQIKNLAVLDRENSKISNNDKIYVDLRIKWKVFLCSTAWDNPKQKENICIENLSYIYGQL